MTSTGNITASSAGAFGIRGAITGSGNIGIVVNGGTVSGGSGAGAGVSFVGGATNTLTNAGTLSPGGSGPIQTTALTGNLVQTGAGRVAVDLNMATGAADRLNVTGTANLAGTVVLNVLTPQARLQEVTILSAAGGTTNAGLAVSSQFNSPAIVVQLHYPNATDVVLGTSINFAVSGLNGNQASLGSHLDAALTAGSSGLGTVVIGLLNTKGLAAYKAALDQLSPEVQLKSQVSSLYSSLNFANNLMSCKVGNGANAFISEGQCVWAQLSARSLRLSDTDSTIGSKEESEQFAGGAQLRFAPNLHLGFAAGYEHSAITSSLAARSSGDRAQGGIALKYTSGPMLLAASISGGQGWYDTTRPMAFGGFNAMASSSNDVSYFGGKLRAAYLLGMGDWYLKPMVDFNATRLSNGGFTETGAGGANLTVASTDRTVLSASPALEIGTQGALWQSVLLRPYVRGGASFFHNTNFGATARFTGTPSGVAGFSTTTSIDRVVADVSAGADLFVANDIALKLSYDGQYGDTTRQHSFGGRASFKF